MARHECTKQQWIIDYISSRNYAIHDSYPRVHETDYYRYTRLYLTAYGESVSFITLI